MRKRAKPERKLSGRLVALLVVFGLSAAAAGWLHLRARGLGNTPQQRIQSLAELGASPSPQATRVIVDALRKDPDPHVRQAALVALSGTAGPQHRPDVEQATQDKAPGVRAAAAEALGAYPDAEAAQRLAEMARADRDPAVRLAAVNGLARCKHPAATVELVEAIDAAPDPQVQYRAVREMYRLAGIGEYIGSPPDQEPRWRGQSAYLAEFLKTFPNVQKAYGETGRELRRRGSAVHTPAHSARPPEAPAP